MQTDNSKQAFKKGQKVYLREDTNVSQIVDDPEKDWSLWQTDNNNTQVADKDNGITEELRTKGTWEVWESSTKDKYRHHLYISSPYNGIICRMNDIRPEIHISKIDLANANFICKAVNNYSKLVEENEKLKEAAALINKSWHNTASKEVIKLIQENESLKAQKDGIESSWIEVTKHCDSLQKQNAKLVEFRNHILAMENDAYLSSHPEWNEIINNAKNL